MSDWQDTPTPASLPGPVTPAPTPFTPGWKELIEKTVDEDHPPGWHIRRLVAVGIRVEENEHVELPIEGDNPGGWTKEKKVEEHKGTPRYNDYTLYRRTYPSLTMQWYQRVSVTIYAKYDDGKIIEHEFDYMVPIGKPVTLPNYRTWLWAHTSGFRTQEEADDALPGLDDTPGIWEERGISDDAIRRKKPTPEEMGTPPTQPPASIKPPPRRRRNRRIGYVIERDDGVLALRFPDGDITTNFEGYDVASEAVGFALWADAAEAGLFESDPGTRARRRTTKRKPRKKAKAATRPTKRKTARRKKA